ncbi:hypothetical protein [Naasia sp. SYSU D00948]|uniref:hypothetical protein n=1 Tax=Naasia sp. SYSU D00948 TaxID=2817379 RepID=UPI001B3065A7|nr:hypothetical protein [Naasia sp. SYSU D00948]
MNHDDEFDPVARLRAADPAADVEAPAGFAGDVVARTLTEPPAHPREVAHLGSERARRRPRWLAYVAVAASVAIVGGAGFGIGATTGGGMSPADGAAPPISLQTGGMARDTGEARDGAVQGGLEGAAPSRMWADDMTHPYGFGRNSFSSEGLSTAAGAASAYAFDARAASNAEKVAALAAALGIEGTVESKDGAWMVGPQDGTAPYLSVSFDGMLSFYFTDPLVDPWMCGTSEQPVPPDAAVEPCTPPSDLPGEDAAIDALRSIIVAAGRDPAAFQFASETGEGSYTRNAQAWPVVDGQRLDQGWSLELTSAGVYSAYGALAGIVPLGDYPIVSEQQGFERLSDPRFGAQMTTMPIALREPTVAEWVPPTEPPATPVAGTSLAWPVNTVSIVSARLGLASQWQPDGSVLVVPAYEFTDADGGTWSVVAVDDSQLDFATD